MNIKQPIASSTLQALRKEIGVLQGCKPATSRQALTFGVAIDDCLPGSALEAGAVHEFISNGYEHAASTVAFTIAVLSRSASKAPIIWISRDHVQYAPGFSAYGLDPQRIIFARPGKDSEAMWIMEEALRCKGVAAVAGECALADLTATRRLQLAAENSGVPGLLLRPFCRQPVSSSCVTRWKISPSASEPNGLPGLGAPRWQVELLKARGGRPGSWLMEWRDQRLSLVTPPAKQIPLPAKTAGSILPFSMRA